jgi:translation initiation factor IF-3
MASKHISHTVSPMKALYSIFVQPALTTSRPKLHILSRNATARTAPTAYATRAFTTTQPLHLSKKKPARLAEVRAHKWNEEITAPMIQLVNPETDALDDPVTRYDILNTLDLKTHRLVQLTEDKPYPVCKIVSKKEEYAAEKRRKEQQKEIKQAAAKERSVKTLELNWAIDGNDLAHRLEKVRTFLEEGRRVEVVLAAKKRGRKASREECEEVLAKIRAVAEGVKGAKETKAMEGAVGGFATLVWQGKAGVAQGQEKA